MFSKLFVSKLLISKLLVSFCVLLYTVGLPFLEINDSHVFNPDWTPHVRIHEVWQLITNSAIGLLCLWYIWVKNQVTLSAILSLLITGGFLCAFLLKDFYGGSMQYLDGSEKTLLGINIGIVGFGFAFIVLLGVILQSKQRSI